VCCFNEQFDLTHFRDVTAVMWACRNLSVREDCGPVVLGNRVLRG
jgi:hypothetical protein